jgi:hypothetical protein
MLLQTVQQGEIGQGTLHQFMILPSMLLQTFVKNEISQGPRQLVFLDQMQLQVLRSSENWYMYNGLTNS